MHDKPHTFLTVVDKTSVHRQVLYGVAICVRSFEFTTGDNTYHQHPQIFRQHGMEFAASPFHNIFNQNSYNCDM